MPELTGKQKRFLRSLGQALSPALIVGKAGLAPGTVAALAGALSRRELLKVKLAEGGPGERKQMAADLAEAVGAACAGVVGRAALLYRPNDSLPAKERINLPQSP